MDPGQFGGMFSAHAAIMIFLFVIPVFAGIANYVLPLMVGAPDMAFPRLNALSFWMLPFAGILFMASFLVPGGAFDAGWTGYAPLATGAPLGQSFFNIGVQFAGFSSIFAAINFLVTIVTMRAPGMTFWRMPLLVWANLATSVLIVAATRSSPVPSSWSCLIARSACTSSMPAQVGTSLATSTSSGSTRTRPCTS